MQNDITLRDEPVNWILETIQHQDSSVFNALVKEIHDMQFVPHDNFVRKETDHIDSVDDNGNHSYQEVTRYRTDDVKLREHEKRLETIINKSFNSNVTVSIGERYGGCRIYDEYHNHVLTPPNDKIFMQQNEEFVRRFIANRDKGGGVRAGVDLKNAKLTGLFSELPATIYLPIQQFTGASRLPKDWRLSAEECAAMLIHEVGHLFTYCEYFTRVVTTNQVLAQISKELDETYLASEREAILVSCKENLNLRGLDAKELAGIADNRVIETVILTECVEQSRSELGCNIYDLTASEQLADQFAVRMGAGRASLTLKFKSDKMWGVTRAYDSTPLYMFKQMLLTVSTFAIPLMTIFVLMGGLDDTGGNKYDTPESRYRRLRNDMIDRTKNRNITPEEKKDILEDIRVADEILTGVKDRRHWLSALGDMIVPKYRKYRNTTQMQKQLEQLASNSLFVRAAELSTL